MSTAALSLAYGQAMKRLLVEIRGEDSLHPLVIAGDATACERVRRGLGADDLGGAIRFRVDAPVVVADLAGASVLVLAIERAMVTPTQEAALRLADRQRVPIVAVVLDVSPGARVDAPPYVLETNVVRVPAGRPLPLEPVLERIAAAVVPGGWDVGRGVPVLRRPICDALIRHYSNLNAGVGAAAFVPAANLPVLTLNQLRLAARIAALHGIPLDRSRLVELAAIVGAGMGLRRVARQLIGRVPASGWAVRGAVAYGGTRAIGEAVVRWAERLEKPAAPAGD